MIAREPARPDNCRDVRPPSPPASSSRIGPVAAYFAAYVALAFVYAAVVFGAGGTLSQAVRNAAAAILPNAVLGLVSVQLPRRLAWDGRRPAALLALHAALLLTLALLGTTGWLALAMLDSWFAGSGLGVPASRMVILFQGLISGLVQLATIAVAHAWRAAEGRARAERLRAQAELALLRSQLNPHFVLNTLHALMGLVQREPATAQVALERLGELLRFGLHVHHAQTDRVPFREEWAFVTSYLELERLRLGDRLRLALTADETVMDVSVPPFAVQPLVENAITHAISPRRGGGRLAVSAERRGGRLHIVVEDDGPGTTEAAVRASPRLGLRLLRERLAALYGESARLSFEPVVPGGLRARLEVPDVVDQAS